MISIKKTAMSACIVISLLGSVGCSANASFIQSASNEVFAANEAGANDLYQNGQKAMNRGDWKKASRYFNDLVKKDTQHTDVALYWYAYSLYKAGKTSSANRALNKLFKEHKNSQWAGEGKALQAEILGIDSAIYNDDEMKEIALNSLLHSSPERALPILKKTLSSNNSSDIKEMALFVLSQIGTPEARKTIEDIALDGSNRELQKNAIEMLAISGDKKSHEILSKLYSKVDDIEIREDILTGFMIGGNKDKLLQAAKTETNPELRATAAELLGQLGAGDALLPLYKNEKSIEVKESIISAMMLSKNTTGISYVIEHESNPELLAESIQMLGMMGDADSNKILLNLWKENNNPDVRESILDAWMLKGDSASIANVAKTSTNKEERLHAIELLGVINGKSFLKELYKSESDAEIKKQLLESLAMSGDKEILSYIIENETDDKILSHAIELAVVFGDNDIFEKLNLTYKNTSNVHIKETIIESHIIKNNVQGLLILLKEEKDQELLGTIIEMLGVMKSDATSTALINFYKTTKNNELKSTTLEAFMIQGNAKHLIEIFRSEKDPQLKKEAARGLALINTEESRAIMLELLEQE